MPPIATTSCPESRIWRALTHQPTLRLANEFVDGIQSQFSLYRIVTQHLEELR
jgi:hypothetical protein